MTREKSRLALWRETRFLGVLSDVGNFLLFAARRFIRDRMSQAAGALTYSTLLALVPLLVIAFAVLSGFPAFDPVKGRIEALFLGILVPEVGADVKAYLSDFTRNASNLTTAGIVALPVTAVLLLSTIESTLNKVWRVDRPRPLVTRLLIFWAILTIGPLLLGASFTMTSDALSTVRTWAHDTSYVPEFELAVTWPKTVLAVLTQAITFTLLYVVIPARRVRFRDAAIGGVFAGLGFQVLRWGFNSFLTSGSTYATIYGAVAIIPIFLVWIYMSWTVIILGAVLSASFPDWWRRRDPLTGRPLSQPEKLEVAVALLAALARQAETGGTMTQDQLAAAVPLLAREEIVEDLLAAGYVAETENERLSLARDLHKARVSDLARDLGLSLGLHDTGAERPALAHVVKATGQLPRLLRQLWQSEGDILGMPIAQAIAVAEPRVDPTSGPVPMRQRK